MRLAQGDHVVDALASEVAPHAGSRSGGLYRHACCRTARDRRRPVTSAFNRAWMFSTSAVASLSVSGEIWMLRMRSIMWANSLLLTIQAPGASIHAP